MARTLKSILQRKTKTATMIRDQLHCANITLIPDNTSPERLASMEISVNHSISTPVVANQSRPDTNQSAPIPMSAKGSRTKEAFQRRDNRSLVTSSPKAPTAATKRTPVSSLKAKVAPCLVLTSKLVRSENRAALPLPSTHDEQLFEADESSISSAGSNLNGILVPVVNLQIDKCEDATSQERRLAHHVSEEQTPLVQRFSSRKTAKLNPNAPVFYPCANSKKAYTSAQTAKGDPLPISSRSVSAAKCTPRIAKTKSRQMREGSKDSQHEQSGLVRAIRMCSFRRGAGDSSRNALGKEERQGRENASAARKIRLIGPNVLNISRRRGIKVTMVSDAFKIFVVDLVPARVCDAIVQLTDCHIQKTGSTLTQETWRKLYTYTTMDLPCCEVSSLRGVTKQILHNVVKIIGEKFHAAKAAAALKPRTWKEPHLLRYQKMDGMSVHTGVELHYDGSHLTWQLMLSDVNDYTGGGTYFSCLQRTIKLKKGQVLVHPGDLYHKGVDIKSGMRNLIVCFMDGFDPNVVDTSDWSNDSSQLEQRVFTV